MVRENTGMMMQIGVIHQERSVFEDRPNVINALQRVEVGFFEVQVHNYAFRYFAIPGTK